MATTTAKFNPEKIKMEDVAAKESRSHDAGTGRPRKKFVRWMKIALISGAAVAVICIGAAVAFYLLGRGPLSAKNSWIRSLAWSPDGSHIAVGAGDNVITVWDATSGNLVTTISRHTGWVRSLAWSPDGTLLASGGGDGSVFLWEPLSGRLVEQLANNATGLGYLDWSPDGSQLAFAGESGLLMLWDSRRRTSAELGSTKAGITGVSWSHDGTRLAVAQNDGSLSVLDATTGKQAWVGAADQGGIQGWVNAVDWSPDDARVASGGDDGVLKLWDAQTGEKSSQLKGDLQIYALAWSAKLPGRLAWSDKPDEILVSDFKGTGLPLHGAVAFAYCLAWSPDDRILAAGTQGGTVLMWDPASGTLLKSLVIPMH